MKLSVLTFVITMSMSPVHWTLVRHLPTSGWVCAVAIVEQKSIAAITSIALAKAFMKSPLPY
jgi:hypothetical protein